MIALSDGQIGWSGQDFDWQRTNCLPRQATGAFAEEPKWIDLRAAKKTLAAGGVSPALSTVRSRLFRRVLQDQAGEWLADLAAPVRGVPKDSLVGEHIRQRRRTRRIVQAAVSVLVVLLLAVGAAWATVIGQHEADLRKARLTAYVQAVSEASREAPGNPRLAAQLDLAAYRLRPTAAAAARLIATENTPLYSSLPVTADVVAFAPGSDVFATGGSFVQLWDVMAAGRARALGRPFGRQHAGRTGWVQAIAFGRGGTLAVIGGETLRLWDVSDLATPRPLGVRADLGPVHAVAFSPDGNLLAVGGGAGTRGAVRLWDVSDPAHPRELGRALAASFGFADSVAFSPDEHMLAVGDSGGYVRLWDVTRPASPTPIRQQLPVDPGTGLVGSLAFSQDSATLAAGVSAGGVRLWNVARPARPYPLGPALIGCASGWGSAAFGPAGLLAAGCGNASSTGGSVRLWNVAGTSAPSPVSLPQAVPTQVGALAVSPDGRVLVSAGSQGRVLLWSLPPVMFNEGQILALSCNPEHGILASVGSGGYVRLWEFHGQAGPRPFGPPLDARSDIIGSLALSPSGRLLATGGTGWVRLWRLADLARSFVLRTGTGVAVSSLAFTPGSRILAVGNGEAPVQLWDVADPARPRKLSTLPGSSHGAVMAFSPHNGILAIGDFDGGVRLWRVADPRRPRPTGRPLQAASLGGLSSLTFTPNAHVLASGADDGTVRLWDVARPARPAPLGPPLNSAVGSYVSVALTDDGTVLVTAGHDDSVHGHNDSVQLWDVKNPADPQPIGRPLTVSAGPALTVSYGPGMPAPLALADTAIITGGTDGAARMWDMNVNDAIKRICAIPGDELTPALWRRYIPQLPYTTTCPQ